MLGCGVYADVCRVLAFLGIGISAHFSACFLLTTCKFCLPVISNAQTKGVLWESYPEPLNPNNTPPIFQLDVVPVSYENPDQFYFSVNLKGLRHLKHPCFLREQGTLPRPKPYLKTYKNPQVSFLAEFGV